MWNKIVKNNSILVGMQPFILLVPRAVASTKGWIKRLGATRWNRLHRLFYVAAVTGTIHYLWAVKKDTFFPAVYFAAFAMLLAYRLIAARRKRSRSQTARSDEAVPA